MATNATDTGLVAAGDAAGEAAAPGRPMYRMAGVIKRWSRGTSFSLEVPELAINAGETVALVGVSGCGKSTMLDMLAMVLRPDSAGHFTFAAEPGESVDVAQAWRRGHLDRLTLLRRAHIGYVLQTGGLLPFLSVRDNVALGRRLLGLPARDEVESLARRLGIHQHLSKLPAQLSVGERQRVAIARALAHRPRVVIADEPTASLDPINAGVILDLFREVASDFGVTLIMATHDWQGVAQQGFRLISFDLTHDPGAGSIRCRACA